MPNISVILAVYNVAPYLKRCMDSLINQTMQDLEIICIDDCSTDNSLEILKEYAKKDNRIIVIESETNQGAAVARNKGLAIAKGEYLGFVDPDDSVDLNYYEELYKKAKEKNVDVVKCQRKTYSLNGDITVSYLNDEIINNKYNFHYEWTTAIYRHSFIKEKNIYFPEECCKAQDVVFLARVIYRGATISLIDNVYYHYYKREGSLDSSKISLKHIVSAFKSKELILKEINNSNLYKRNIGLYINSYSNILCKIFYNLFQNDSYAAKELCANALIEGFYKCKDMNKLTQEFPYPWMLKYIQNKDTKKLAKLLFKYKNKNYIEKPLKWYQKIFAIKNSKNKKHKIITIFGIKIKIKRKERGINNAQN